MFHLLRRDFSGRLVAAARRNMGYKLLSLAIGILLYAVALAQNNPRLSQGLFITTDAIEPRNIPADLVLKNGPPAVSVTVQGQLSVIEAFRMQPVKAYMDLSRATRGRFRAPIRYRADNALEVVGPLTVEVEITRKARQTFTVDTQFNNWPPPGYAYEEPTTKPRTVQVTGLESEVQKVGRVVASLDNPVNGGPMEQSVELVAQTDKEETVDTVEIVPPRVLFSLRMKKAPATKYLVLSADLSGVPAPGYAFTGYTFEPNAIEVSGPQAQLSKLSSLRIPIDITDLAQSEKRVVSLALPEGVKRVGQGSNRVSVQLEVEATQVAPSTTSTPTSTPPTATPATATPYPIPSPVGTVTPYPVPSPVAPLATGSP